MREGATMGVTPVIRWEPEDRRAVIVGRFALG